MTTGQDSPRARALLHTVMEVAGEDRELPLHVLTSMHRGVLRQPLVDLAAAFPIYGDRAVAFDEFEDTFDARFPGLAGGRVFRGDETVRETVSQLIDGDGYLLDAAAATVLADLELRQPKVHTLIVEADNSWYGYDPLVVLHRMTWGHGSLVAFLPLLEAQLLASPAVEAMIKTMIREPFSPS